MPAVSQNPIQVKGLRDLQRAFARADDKLLRELKTKLKEAAEPVRAEAEKLAKDEISGMARAKHSRWWRMRVGVTRSLVYVAPVERGSRAPVIPRHSFFGGLISFGTNLGPHRPNLAGLLMDKAMQKALDAHLPDALRSVGQLLDDVGRTWER